VHGPVLIEVGIAIDLKSELIEIVPVAGRIEIARLVEQPESEVARRALLAIQKNLFLQSAGSHIAGLLVDRHLVALNNLHKLIPS
jgi:hypothetical protein